MHELGHRFSDTWLFRGRSGTLDAGSLCGLAGPSGCGKSTLLAILAGMLTPTVGSVSFDGSGDRDALWMFQSPFGTAQRTTIDHVALPLLAQGHTRREATVAARQLLEEFDLAHIEDRLFKELSGGQAQRLMLARALARNPTCLLIDEPTAQLDRRSASAVTQKLINLRSVNRIVVVASHDTAVLDQCDQVVRLGDG